MGLIVGNSERPQGRHNVPQNNASDASDNTSKISRVPMHVPIAAKRNSTRKTAAAVKDSLNRLNPVDNNNKLETV